MKFVVLTSVAILLCVSESEGFRKYRGSSPAIIKIKFGLTMKELKAKCLAKNKAYWIDVLEAIQLNVNAGESLVCDIVERVSHSNHPTPHDYDVLIKDHCYTNTVIVNIKEFITSRILKCLDKDEYPSEARRPAILKKAIDKTCKEVKKLAKERTQDEFW